MDGYRQGAGRNRLERAGVGVEAAGRSGVEAIGIRDGLAVLEVAAQDAEIERPAMRGYAIVFVGGGPATVVEAHLRATRVGGQLETHAGAQPVGVRPA